ncbi:tetraprenyl-beta-curcumene synthase [Peribacillus deserti]|uniref:Tetraprenyl-beta-curcumene synthase n=1 Tax=Peribacillus deserti TaxID=673318 RepID=A0ABS2QJ20_9BACI|nr:tetraprenyl-beta-curcumene synthase family protein [Peribacillus deserti]MBM7692965.1 tetraprenyl-beta-curcumene synthase [Peribacillus deserti]
MAIPETPLTLMSKTYLNILPLVHKELAYWKKRAGEIPDSELRKQAGDSIESKAFHCEGGGILALAAEDSAEEAVKFIVAYQTISDYLDNLCDRSVSLDPDDFSALHESMLHALTVGAKPVNYYRYRSGQDDQHYLRDLVLTCQNVLAKMNHYDKIQNHLIQLCTFYCDLQVHKHVHPDKRVSRLQNWHNTYKDSLPEMSWYEFSACSGSTLGIFCLTSYAFRDDFEKVHGDMICEGYFPYIQGLHILLDYLIDQEEDRAGGDLNFCFYYQNEQEMMARLEHFVRQAEHYSEKLPHKQFHKLIHRGLLGIYLSDEKVRSQKHLARLAKKVRKLGGGITLFFYLNGRMYRGIQKISPLKA